ncbi:MAG: hypothetical protein AAF745_05255 [Planctomycetota bacterium]
MAKKSGPNKSKAIREYHAANPHVKPMEMAAALKKQGVDVKPGFISTVISTDKRNSKKTGARRGPGSRKTAAKTTSVKPGPKPASKASGEVSLDSLLQVKKIVEEMGSVQDAQVALTALEKLMG